MVSKGWTMAHLATLQSWPCKDIEVNLTQHCPAITRLFNMSIVSRNLPKDWKSSLAYCTHSKEW